MMAFHWYYDSAFNIHSGTPGPVLLTEQKSAADVFFLSTISFSQNITILSQVPSAITSFHTKAKLERTKSSLMLDCLIRANIDSREYQASGTGRSYQETYFLIRPKPPFLPLQSINPKATFM